MSNAHHPSGEREVSVTRAVEVTSLRQAISLSTCRGLVHFRLQIIPLSLSFFLRVKGVFELLFGPHIFSILNEEIHSSMRPQFAVQNMGRALSCHFLYQCIRCMARVFEWVPCPRSCQFPISGKPAPLRCSFNWILIFL